MVRIFIVKLLGSLLSLWLISILIFFLSKAVPGDSIQSSLSTPDEEAFEMEFDAEYQRVYKNRNLDLPSFYFSLLPRNFPNDLQSILPIQKQKWLRGYLFEGYDFNGLSNLYTQLTEIEKLIVPDSLATNYRLDANKLYAIKEMSLLKTEIIQLSEKYGGLDTALFQVGELNKTSPLNILPRLYWNGFKNQYHVWFSGFLKGDLGVSYIDQKSVWKKIKRSAAWTFFFVIFTLILSYSIGITLGILMNQLKEGFVNLILQRILFGIYAIPLFWLATLLLVFFTTSEYGKWTNIFPSVGLAPIDTGEPWLERILEYGKQLILPVFCLVLHNLAFLSTLTKRNLQREGKRPFILTSKSFGYRKSEILWRDILPHSLLPLITSLTSAIPAAFGGSLVIEIIFNIPGMGRLMYNGLIYNDWPLVFGVVMLIASLSILSFWLAEVLYRWADPRLRISKSK